MFCTKCGRPIPEGQQSCSFCNPPAQTPLASVPKFERAPMDLSEPVQAAPVVPSQEPLYQPPAQEPVYQPPVQQPLYQPPTQEPLYQPPVQEPVYQPPVQQPVYQPPVQQPMYQAAPQQSYQAPVQQAAPSQPAFTLNTPAEGRKPKKSKGGKIVLAVIALLLVAAIVLAAINWKGIVRFFNRNFGEPVAYLQDVEKENVADVAEDVAVAYDEALALYNAENPAAEGTLTLELGSAITTVLSTALAQNGMNADLSWVDNIMLTPKVEMYENTMRMDVGVGINSTSLATVSAVWDMDSQALYIGIPELHDTYIQLDATEVLGSEASSMVQALAMSRELSATLLEAMPDGAQLKELINKYLGIVIDGIPEAEKSNESVKAGSLEQDLLVVTAKLSQKDILKIASAVLEEAKDDKTIEDILVGFEDCMAEISGESMELYDSFSEAMEEGIDSLDSMIDEADKGKFLTIETFFDGKDAIVGRTFTVSMDGEKVSAHYVTVTEGDKWAFEAEMDAASITGKGTIQDGKRSGSYTLSVDGIDYATLELENYICAEQQVTGTFRFIPEAAVYEMMELDSTVSAVLGQAALELTLAADSVTLGIEAAGSQLLAVSLSGKMSEAGKIALPNGVSSEDDAAGMKWLSELDFDAVLSNLEKAGVPSQYMDMAKQLVQMLRAEIN